MYFKNESISCSNTKESDRLEWSLKCSNSNRKCVVNEQDLYLKPLFIAI